MLNKENLYEKKERLINNINYNKSLHKKYKYMTYILLIIESCLTLSFIILNLIGLFIPITLMIIKIIALTYGIIGYALRIIDRLINLKLKKYYKSKLLNAYKLEILENLILKS